jgi:cephalosporin-C deacetylase-like acetyl esterase
MNTSPAYGHMLQEYYRQQLLPVFAQRKERLRQLKTRDDALAYVADVKNKIKESFGPFPEKTPLNARTVGIVEYENYTIEKVIYESRPDFPVSASLYLPRDIKGKVPAVLGVCGHSSNGKLEGAYQSFCQSLVNKGFAVLIYDPVSQGERHQFDAVPEGKDIAKSCTQVHNILGKELRLCDDFFGTWRVWDGIRGIDYLCSRPEVDTSRLGVTGNSGGGTTSSYINALDDRLTMAAPACYITTFMRNFDNELPTDSEQIPPGIIAAGCDMVDFLIAQAPRPTVILAKSNDFFDPRGAVEAYEDAKIVYSLLGIEDNIQLKISEGNHGFCQSNRERMYKLFCSCAGIEDDGKEPELDIRPDEELYCAPNGNTSKIENARVVADFIKEKAAGLKADRKTPANLSAALAEVLKISPSDEVPEYKILRHKRWSGKYLHSQFALTTEAGITCVMRHVNEEGIFSHIPKVDSATLYISHLDAREETEAGISEIEINNHLFALDVRGTGDSTPMTCDGGDDYFNPYQADYFYAAHSIMLNKTYLGGKVQDALAAINLLKANGTKEINLVGRGLGSIVAAFAAVLSDKVNTVTLINAPVSYQQMIEDVMTYWPLSYMPPAMLKVCDLPDLYKALEAKSLKIIDQWDSMFRVI